MQLPADPLEASAKVVAFVSGDDVYQRSAALEGITARISKLSDMDSPDALDELRSHLPVLHVVYLKLTAEAFEAKNPDHKARLMKLALSAQTNYARTAALLAGLDAQRKGRGAVVVHDSDGDGDDDDR